MRQVDREEDPPFNFMMPMRMTKAANRDDRASERSDLNHEKLMEEIKATRDQVRVVEEKMAVERRGREW